ncbi:exonuclease mut-7 homolog [Nephila pilipes]|uniref:Exonuclease mut-7 homolog n=1 Tax=Nephila pilipes TaxID=299642 RepID=A0A8X6TKR6_NEPPI|nr:exonuclease mut-7 homolog [Nephila pilipes]
MFCYRRLLRRALNGNKWSVTRFISSSQIHKEFPSPQTNEIPVERKPSLSAIREVRNLEYIWRKNRIGKVFKRAVHEYFFKSEASPTHSVDLLRVACDKSHFQSELVYYLLVNLNNAINENDIDFSPSIDDKLEAFRSVLIYKNYEILQEVCNVFKIHEQSRCFKEIIDDLINQQRLVEAAYCIGVLNLQLEYDVENLFFPLLERGVLQPVISCIRNCPDLQLSMAKKLDSILITGDICSGTRTRILNSKKIFNVLNKIVDMFNIPTENCKNLHYVRSRAAVNLLIKRRSEQSVSEETFENMVMSIIGENAQLKDHLIYKLIKQNDKETALKMIEKLNMIDFDVTKLNLSEDDKINLENIADNDELDDISDEQCEHLTFSLSSSDIKFVDTKEEFVNFIKDIMKYNIIGMDTEWKPHFGLSADRLALIQIATHDKVYILDMVSLNDCLTSKLWDELMENVFGNPKIIKLGCGIMGDVQMIVGINQGTKGKKIRFTHMLDMAIFYEKLEDIYPDEFKKEPGKENRKGLSKLCEIILGQPLNKEERLCDWEKRPLSESQIQYAALDAHCLIQMYDKLKQDAVEKNFNFDHLANVSMFLTTNQWKPKKSLRGVKHEKDLQIEKPIPIEQFKVVMDSGLEAQGKQLRQLGADVLILNSSDTPQTAAEVSKSQERILICSFNMFLKAQHIYPDAVCFRPLNKYGDHVPIASILHRFNVKCNANFFSSRCVVCNSEENVKLTLEDLNLLQKYIKSKDFMLLNSERENNFQKTLSDMIKSGINVKFKNEEDCNLTEKSQALLCKKCGTIQ